MKRTMPVRKNSINPALFIGSKTFSLRALLRLAALAAAICCNAGSLRRGASNKMIIIDSAHALFSADCVRRLLWARRRVFSATPCSFSAACRARRVCSTQQSVYMFVCCRAKRASSTLTSAQWCAHSALFCRSKKPLWRKIKLVSRSLARRLARKC